MRSVLQLIDLVELLANNHSVALKFATELSRLAQPCPNPEKFAPRNCTAYRFLRNPATESDFEPNLNEVRGKVTCAHYALSFFASIEQAQAKYSSLASVHDDDGQTAIERYGDHVGELSLTASDGMMDEPNPKSGHIGLHQAVGVTFAGRVRRFFKCAFLDQFPVAYNTRTTPNEPVNP